MARVRGPDACIDPIGNAEFEKLLEKSLRRHFHVLAERLESTIHVLAEQLQTGVQTPGLLNPSETLREPPKKTVKRALSIQHKILEIRTDGAGYAALAPAASSCTPQSHSLSPEVKRVADRRRTGLSSRAEGFCGFLKIKQFNEMVAVAICINALALGAEADYLARNWKDDTMPAFFEYINSILCILFVSEVILRVLLIGRQIFASRELQWTVLSFFVTSVQVAEEVLKFSSAHLNFSISRNSRNVLRLLRTLRVVMIFPILDQLHAIDELNLLIVSIGGSLKSLTCTLSVLALVTFVFGVPLTHVVTNFKATHPNETEAIAELSEFYSSLDQTMMSLFQSISEGVHWREIMTPLTTHCSPWLALAFILYIFISVFAMTNVVTGIFVDSAVKTSETDKRGKICQGMMRLFAEADIDGSGTISKDEFEEHLKDNKEMKFYLRALQIEEEQASEMFKLLDADGSGTIDRDEFVYGCLRFQGATKAIDFASFACEYRDKYSALVEKIAIVQEQLRQLERRGRGLQV